MKILLNSNLNKLQKDFYFNGFVSLNIKDNSEKNEFLKDLKLWDKLDLTINNKWKSLYKNTYDLIDAEKIKNKNIINFMKSNLFLEKIELITGRKLVLGDFTIRKTYGSENYLKMHRDTYIDKKNKLVGRTPPLIKLIFYPELKNISTQLTIIPKSHKLIFNNYFINKFISIFQKKYNIKNNNNNVIIFQSDIYHEAAKQGNIDGNFRCIFNFCSPSQLTSFKNGKKIALKFNSKK